MKFFIISCLILCSASVSKAQLDSAFKKTDREVLIKIQELRDKKISNIVCYYVDCTGKPPKLIIDNNNICTADDIKFLMWQDKSKSFIQRFDECKDYEPIHIHSNLLNIIRSNYLTIKKEVLKSSISMDHYCSTKFEIYKSNSTLVKRVDWPDLDKYIYDKHLNRYYSYNQGTILNKLKKIAEAEVIAYNKTLSQ